jgi:uncharacterized protein (TIGR03000 family)
MVLPPALDDGLIPRVLREPDPLSTVALIDVFVPEGAEVWFNGAKTRQTGTRRGFESPPLEPGERYGYDVKARWKQDGKTVERTFHVPVNAGSHRSVDFTK